MAMLRALTFVTPVLVLALNLSCGEDSFDRPAREGSDGSVPTEQGAGGGGAGEAPSLAGATSTVGGGATSDPDWTNGIPPLHTDGRVIADPQGNVVVLRGVALADMLEVDTERPGMDVSAVIDRVSDESGGFYARVVRLTVLPERWLPDPEGYFSDHLEPAVRYASTRGLYVIVDWHEIDDVEAVAERTTAFWDYVAPQFAEYTNVLYEIFNEPVNSDNPSWPNWKTYAQYWVDLIRSHAPANLILIGGPFWSQMIGEAATDPVVGDNLVYVGHIYPIIDPNTWSAFGPMAQVAEVAPLMITEWGFRNDGNEIWNGTRASFGEPLKQFIKSRGLSWTAWCADNLWGPVMFDEDWALLAGEGEMGEFVKAWLAEER